MPVVPSRGVTSAGAPSVAHAAQQVGYAGRLPAAAGTAAAAPAAAAAAAAGLVAGQGKKMGAGQKLATAGSGGSKGSGVNIPGVRSRGVSDDGALEQLQVELATWRTAADTATKEKEFYVR